MFSALLPVLLEKQYELIALYEQLNVILDKDSKLLANHLRNIQVFTSVGYIKLTKYPDLHLCRLH